MVSFRNSLRLHLVSKPQFWPFINLGVTSQPLNHLLIKEPPCLLHQLDFCLAFFWECHCSPRPSHNLASHYPTQDIHLASRRIAITQDSNHLYSPFLFHGHGEWLQLIGPTYLHILAMLPSLLCHLLSSTFWHPNPDPSSANLKSVWNHCSTRCSFRSSLFILNQTVYRLMRVCYLIHSRLITMLATCQYRWYHSNLLPLTVSSLLLFIAQPSSNFL